MNKVMYINRRRGRVQGDMGLQLGAELGADVVVIAEAVEDQERRNVHATYVLTLNTRYLVVYVRKNKQVKCKKKGNGEWVAIGDTLGAAYLPPHMNQHQLREVMSQLMQKDTIIGDLNCCGGTKKKTLEALIEERGWEDIGTTEHTHEWGNHKCRIDRVLTRGGARPWAIKEGWGCLSDHSAVGVRAQLVDMRHITLKQTDWRKVREYVEKEEEKEKEEKAGIRRQTGSS